MLCAHRAHLGTLVQVTRARTPRQVWYACAGYARERVRARACVRVHWYEGARPASSRALLCYAQTSVIPAPSWHAYFHSVRMVAVNFKPWTFSTQASDQEG